MKIFGYSRAILFYLALQFFSACGKFEYTPYQQPHKISKEPLNRMNIDLLKEREAYDDDTITILLTGDSQRSYRSLDALVTKVNSIDKIDFLILAGDITDFGLKQEFRWINERLSALKVPYLCAIGNHDLTAGGPGWYEAIYGPRNFSFSYKGCKFIFHDFLLYI
jgi:Icc-related predicted phosphoesterase